jgi:hypothetical protein
MKMFIAIIMTSAAALADTWTMTNGVPITGTVVSSQVACVWIKTPLGAVRQIPVAAFKSESCERLPADAAGIFVAYDMMDRAATKAFDAANASTDKLMEFVATAGRSTVDLKNATDSIANKHRLLLAEVEAWRDANTVRDTTPKQRQAFVDEQVGKTAAEILKEQ